jgi:hypothetical protein
MLVGRTARVAKGIPNNDVRFGAVWDGQALYVGVQVVDERVVASSPVADRGDAVEIYVDGENSKTLLYGAHHRRIVIGPEGELWLPDGRDVGIERATVTTSDGYSIELAIPWANLEQAPDENMTLGFDVANQDDDTGSGREAALYWFGDATDADNPRAWGNLLLSTFAPPGSNADAGDVADAPPADEDHESARGASSGSGCRMAANSGGAPAQHWSFGCPACLLGVLGVALAGRRRRRRVFSETRPPPP